MVNTTFEAYKIKRELKRNGIDYEFKRFEKNAFGEPIKDAQPKAVGTLKGLYHEQNSNVEITTGDTTQVRTKKIPTILCLHEDAASLCLSVGDTVQFNGKTFALTGVVNVQEWNIIADISLEVVDNGVPA